MPLWGKPLLIPVALLSSFPSYARVGRWGLLGWGEGHPQLLNDFAQWVTRHRRQRAGGTIPTGRAPLPLPLVPFSLSVNVTASICPRPHAPAINGAFSRATARIYAKLGSGFGKEWRRGRRKHRCAV